MMKEIPSFEEKSESFEEPQEEFVLNEQIFDKFDTLSERASNAKKRKAIESVVAHTKRAAFEYFEESLDRFSDHQEKDLEAKNVHSIPQRVGVRQDVKDEGEHVFINRFGTIVFTLSTLGIFPSWKSKLRSQKVLFEKAAFGYVTDILLQYQQALQNQEDPQVMLEKRHLSNVVDPRYIEDHILRKIDELPPTIKENLFKIYK